MPLWEEREKSLSGDAVKSQYSSRLTVRKPIALTTVARDVAGGSRRREGEGGGGGKMWRKYMYKTLHVLMQFS